MARRHDAAQILKLLLKPALRTQSSGVTALPSDLEQNK